MNKYKNTIIAATAWGCLLCTPAIVSGQIPAQPSYNTYPIGGVTPLTPVQRVRAYKWIHLTKSTIAELRVGNYPRAEDMARQAIDTHVGPGFEELLVEALHAQGKDIEALPYYRTLSDEGQTSPRYELPYAMLLLKTGQWPQAVAAYNRALPFLNDGELLRTHSSFSSDLPRTKELMTAIHIGLGIQYTGSASWGGRLQTDEALLNFRQAIALEPNNALARYQYGIGLARAGHTPAIQAQARAAFAKAAALDNGDIQKAALKQMPGGMHPR